MLDDFRDLCSLVDFHDKETIGGVLLVLLVIIFTVIFLAATQ